MKLMTLVLAVTVLLLLVAARFTTSDPPPPCTAGIGTASTIDNPSGTIEMLPAGCR